MPARNSVFFFLHLSFIPRLLFWSFSRPTSRNLWFISSILTDSVQYIFVSLSACRSTVRIHGVSYSSYRRVLGLPVISFENHRKSELASIRTTVTPCTVCPRAHTASSETASALGFWKAEAVAHTHMSFDADVVVIGAGLAGLRAAADLQARPRGSPLRHLCYPRPLRESK